MQGRLYLWAVPPAKHAGTLRAVWYSPERDPCMCLNVVPLSHVPRMKGVWGVEGYIPKTGESLWLDRSLLLRSCL